MIIQSAAPGPASLFSMAAFGRPDQQFQQQLQQINHQTQQNLRMNYGFDASAFYQSSNQFFQAFQDLAGIKQAEAIISMGKAGSIVAIDSTFYTPIVKIEDFASANLVQQTYLMSNPIVRQMFLDKEIEAYNSTYVNHWGNNVGFEDPVYRQMVSGVSQSSYMELDEDVDESYFETFDDAVSGLPEPTAIERSNMLQANRLLEVQLAEGINPLGIEIKYLGK